MERRPGAPLMLGERFRRRDADAILVAFDRLAPPGRSEARRICRCRFLAEDALQTAFVDAWRRADTYDPSRGALSTWFLRIVRNRSLDAVRHRDRYDARVRRYSAAVAQDLPADDLDELIARREQSASIDAALTRLPAGQGDALRLAFVDELSHTEIAERLGVPLGTIKSRIRLGLRRLGRELDPDELGVM